MRLNIDGSADLTFGVVAGLNSGYTDTSNTKVSLAIQADDKIYVGGTKSSPSTGSNRIFNRLTANGTVDSSYNLFGLSLSYVTHIDLQTDGKLLLSSGSALVRLLNTGVSDSGFSATDIYVDYFKSRPDGKVMVKTGATGYPVLRLNNDGTTDSSFTFYATDNTNLYNFPFDILPDNGLLLGTSSVTTMTNYPDRLTRVDNAGNLDIAFSDGTGFVGGIYEINQLISGKVIVGGSFSSYNGQPENNIVRLLGQDYYMIQGQNKLDSNNNGCDAADLVFPNMKFHVASASNADFIANTSGNYAMGMTAGNYTITPMFENPTYYAASPSSIAVSFPTQASPLLQNFCVTPTGTHRDLEVNLFPLNAARPGIDAIYKLVYKNKGNQLQSGTINVTFNDAVSDLVSATPATSAQSTNNLSWTFSNLNPFETREILFTLNLNTPTETPPLVSNSVLDFTSVISSTFTDETPSDNTSVVHQTVFNSFDPNDKICTEGTSISTTKVGDYVHYIIHFENKGSAAAVNISVQDAIDTSKFDINTLVPLTGSHLYTTRITNGNKVEFLFENINLPFAAGTNDGYVAFKIKTKSTLVLGDTFSNTASIYFDFNSSITTNTTLTTVGVLSNADFAFASYFGLYPNPVKDKLNITNKNNIELKSIEIFNMLGQRVLIVPNAKDLPAIDVSSLKTGNYLIKINSDKGTSASKFIKN
jgi:uncharacterized repeat protein (TIGR01451 family)